jgi:hypothetical protein
MEFIWEDLDSECGIYMVSHILNLQLLSLNSSVDIT